ncbi:MAG: hypothetical protein HOW73_26365 [Polyangiaceae bacterium]|nr:hypothetical protein [Polyangiaceae bacterium]
MLRAPVRFAASFAFLACLTTAGFASAQSAGRSSITVQPPPPPAGDVRVTVEVDGRTWPTQTYGQPMPIESGRHLIRAYGRDGKDAVLAPDYGQAIYIPANVAFQVGIPRASYQPRSGLVAGGIAITTLGVLSFVGSIFAFYVADAAGTECHEEGFATGVCGAPPGPYIGAGVVTLLFGLNGMIGGPVMIAEGVKPKMSWDAPQLRASSNGLQVRWQF